MDNVTLDIRPRADEDLQWATELLFPGGRPHRVASRGLLHDPLSIPGYVAWRGDERVGLATYRFEGDECELLTLDSTVENIGAGTALIEAVRGSARAAGCRRLWLITTNDNTHAFRFYQRRGFTVAEVRPGAITRAREQLKPEIPHTGNDGIPIRDEIELEIVP